MILPNLLTSIQVELRKCTVCCKCMQFARESFFQLWHLHCSDVCTSLFLHLTSCAGRILVWRRGKREGSECSHALPISATPAVPLEMRGACCAAGAARLLTTTRVPLHRKSLNVNKWSVGCPLIKEPCS